MQKAISVVATLRSLIAALKSFLRGKSIIRFILAFWSKFSSPASETGPDENIEPDLAAPASPSTISFGPKNEKVPKVDSSTLSILRDIEAQKPDTSSISKTAATVICRSSSDFETSPSPLSAYKYNAWPSSSPDQQSQCPSCHQNSPFHDRSNCLSTRTIKSKTTIDSFLRNAKRLLLEPVQGIHLQDLAANLQVQFHDRLLNNAACMLPSYIHQLPDGSELGRFLSLDVGGSTLRVALIELRGNSTAQGVESMEILRKDTYKITPELKSLEGMKFFDWIAVRILEVMSEVESSNHTGPLPIGLAWSFPIQQTSLRGGIIQGMGKGFCAADSLIGQDLGDVIQTACIGRGLRVKVAAVVNDSAAALLSAAYIQNATRFGLVLGTGVNIAIHLPVRAVGTAKFGARPATWFDEASHVIVNTELGMFGHGILPVTRWDALLNEQHLKPDFQPLEYMVSGCYLGEIARLALLEAVESAGLFGGDVPPSLLTPYALDTETLSVMETDKSSSLELATSVFHEKHPTGSGAPLSIADIRVVCTLASLIAQRSAAILGASVYALWALKVETERELIEANLVEAHTRNAQAELAILQSRTVVAFNGSVMEQYPHYREHCQAVIDSLATEKTSATTSTIDLVPAEESSLLGAVVALACLRAE